MIQLTPIGIFSNVFAIITLRYIYMFIMGTQIPFITGNKQATLILFVMGLAMSMLAGIRDSNTVNFESMSPIVLKSLMGLGVFAVVIGLIVLSGLRIPVFSEYVIAYKMLAGIIGIKLIIMRGYLLIQMLR
jgi:hypothetical protein